MTVLPALAALATTLLATAALAADDGRVERERIARERSEAQRRFVEQERECHSRFVVTACLDDARAERREALDHLRAQQRVLDEADRRRRAAERVQAIRDKVERAPPPGAPPPLRVVAPRAGPGEPASAPAPTSRKRAPVDPAERAARERAATEQYEARQREAEHRRDENARRNVERASKRPVPAAPLPVPAGAAPEAPARP